MSLFINKLDLKDMISNPGNYYASPDEVVSDTKIDRDTKIKILDSWGIDQTNLMVAEEENMTTAAPQGKAAEKLRKITDAREQLG